MSINKKMKGFTLIELIGVMAIIAILASVAAPRVFESIEDAKVTKLVQQVQTIKSAATDFYADTGRYPLFQSGQTNRHYNSFLYKDSANTAGANIPGWAGPYLDAAPTHPIVPGGFQSVLFTNAGAYICDADGDGTTEGPWLVYRFGSMNLKLAEKVSGIIDGDAGTSDWATKGKVKMEGGTSTNTMVVCLQR